jgi:hypothetical protein
MSAPKAPLGLRPAIADPETELEKALESVRASAMQTAEILSRQRDEALSALAAERERIARAIEANMNHDATRNATLATVARIAREGDTPPTPTLYDAWAQGFLAGCDHGHAVAWSKPAVKPANPFGGDA